MPWKVSSVVEERLRFVVLASRPGAHLTALCREFGVSRQTGYVWLKRYQSAGAAGMVERSRRPHHSPKRTGAEVEAKVVALRQRWPDWGAPKLKKMLTDEGVQPQLSERTVHRILKRRGLVQAPNCQGPADRRFEREEPNQLWQMDFKGPQGFNRSGGVGPLSILDDHSRYLLALEALGSTQMAGVQRCLEQAFEAVGVPEALLMDHGTPWWNAVNPWGVSELTVWIMQQGVRLYISGIRHPQTQGKVERMHGALQLAVRRRGADPEQQQWLDEFRHEYNHIRPHEALDMATPSTRWQPSPRAYQAQPKEWEYPASMQVVQLCGQGQFQWQKRRWDVSRALRGQRVGLEPIGDRVLVYFCNTPLRELDPQQGTSTPIKSNLIKNLNVLR